MTVADRFVAALPRTPRAARASCAGRTEHVAFRRLFRPHRLPHREMVPAMTLAARVPALEPVPGFLRKAARLSLDLLAALLLVFRRLPGCGE